MTFADYFLLSIFYFWASSTALSLGIGYYTIYRPVMAGMIAGLILKDAQKGMMAGAVVNIIYIDFVSTGGSFKGDQCLTAILAAMASILFNLYPLEASALAYPFGFLGILIWKYRLKINNVFVHIYEKKYKDKKNPDISVYDGLLPQSVKNFSFTNTMLFFPFLIIFSAISSKLYVSLLMAMSMKRGKLMPVI
jgi:mannose/fructose/N-acetylgalactosamine-specific phosphotransferase system component IIC